MSSKVSDPATANNNSANNNNNTSNNPNPNPALDSSFAEIAHYVVTAHPPGCVLSTAQCNFVAPKSVDVLIAKAGRLEVRQLRASASTASTETSTSSQPPATADLANPFPVLFQVPINGRIIQMVPFSLYHSPTSLVFFLTDRHQYGVLGYYDTHQFQNAAGGGHNQTSLYPIVTHASGSITASSFWAQGMGGSLSSGSSTGVVSGSNGGGGDGGNSGGGSGGGASPWTNENALAVLGREAEAGPCVVVDPLHRCIVMHLHSGLLAILPIQRHYNPSRAVQEHARPKYKNDSSSVPRSSNTSSNSCLAPIFFRRVEERTILAMTFLQFPTTTDPATAIFPHICILHQDARGVQHVTTHILNLQKRQLYLMQTTALAQQEGVVEWLRKTAVDGGSAMLLSVPPPSPPAAAAAAAPAASSSGNENPSSASTANATTSGGIIVVGQRQFTYCSSTTTKVIPVPQALYLSCTNLPPDPHNGGTIPRFLLSDEFGNLHMLTLMVTASNNNNSASSSLVLGMQLETLGSCNLCRDLSYLGHGLAYVASHLGDSQLIQIHNDPIPVHNYHDATIASSSISAAASGRRGTSATLDEESESAGATNAAAALDTDMDVLLADTTYIQVLEEYTNLGPILDFDLVPTAPPTSSTNNNNGAALLDGQAGSATSAAPAASPQTVQQSQVVTCSGSSKMGSLRLVRNGIGMNEYASVEIPGISNMWSLRQTFRDINDTYLVQSFVGETRVLGVTLIRGTELEDDDGDKAMTEGAPSNGDEEEEQFGSLEEVVLPGLESAASTLYVGNLPKDRILQITEMEIRLIGPLEEGGFVLDTWLSSSDGGPITVAAANETGQIALAQQGGKVLFFQVEDDQTIQHITERQMEQEVSCLNLNPFHTTGTESTGNPHAMDVDGDNDKNHDLNPTKSRWLAVGLWDDFTVRLLDLESSNLDEVQKIHLSSQTEGEDDDGETAEMHGGVVPGRRNRNNMMARSLCLITLDFSSSSTSGSGSPTTGHNKSTTSPSSTSPGVNMLFVGLGDGNLISFAVLFDPTTGRVTVRAKKEVCLGTQRIDLVPLSTRGGGSCVLATGDRPTVIYLAGIGGGHASSSHFNPKLCYSSVNLSASEDDEDDNDHEMMNDRGRIRRPPAQQSIAVNVAAPFYSPLLFDSTASTAGIGAAGSAPATSQHYSLCIADESCLRLGVIDDIQKLHVTTCRLGMAPRRIVHCADGRLFAVGCIESGVKHLGGAEALHSMANCIRFMDDTNFDDIKRVDMDPFEEILSMSYVSMSVPDREGATSSDPSIDSKHTGCVLKSFLVVGTGYSMAHVSEVTRGRLLLFSCEADENSANGNRTVRQVTELSTNGGVFSVCQFYEGTILCSVNTKTMVCRLYDDAGLTSLQFVGVGHHGHILSLYLKSGAQTQPAQQVVENPKGQTSHDVVKSRSEPSKKDKKAAAPEMLAIIGDLMRSVSVVQYFPEHQILEEIARDYHANWTTAIEMINDVTFLAGEHWCNLFCLRRNKHAGNEEQRGRLDIVGEYHLAEMCNKFMSGSLVMPVSANSVSMASNRRQQRARRVGSAKISSSNESSDTKSPSDAARTVRRPVVVTGSQTLFGTVDGTLGVILGLDGRTAAFFTALERAMARVIRPIGDLSHQMFRAFQGDRRMHPAHGFVDGDLVEGFLDLDRNTMDAIVREMNRDGGWEVDDGLRAVNQNNTTGAGTAVTSGDEISFELSVEDVVAMVEEISMLH